MDAFIGSWKLQKEKNENFTPAFGAALGVSSEHFDEFCKMQITQKIAKADGDGYTYTYCIDDPPETWVLGPFKLGEPFEFFDTWENRTEQNVYSQEGTKMVEKTTIKENPKINWVTHRYFQDGLMVMETACGGHTAKQFFAKV